MSTSLSRDLYSYLEQDEFQRKYCEGSHRQRARFHVSGVSCARCVSKIESLPLTTHGLLSVQMDLGTHVARVEFDPALTSLGRIATAIAALGFKPVPIERGEDAAEFERREARAHLIRLAVAAFCAGNIMTFAFATYLGAPAEWSRVFGWLSFALYLPVLTFVAYPFYRGAWDSLRRRQISIDLPMAIASASGFVFSTIELARGRDDYYFDSLSGFLLLILVSRFLQRRLQSRYLQVSSLAEGLNVHRVRLLDGRGWSWRPLDVVKPGDRILLHAPEVSPADAELVTGRAPFSLAWLSGESKPKTFLRGGLVPAGARLLTGEAHLIVRRPLPETSLGRILQDVQKFSLAKSRIGGAADRWAQVLLASVFVVAAAFVAVYWHVSPEEAIRRALALIILACPCAMAFGTPLALAAALKRSRRLNLAVRDAAVFEEVAEIDTVYFDKTGTLTETELVLGGTSVDLTPVYKKIILSLENESLHPIAFALRHAFGDLDALPTVEGAREIAGIGVSGFVYGRFYEIKRDHSVPEQTGCAFFEEDRLIARLHFQGRLKPDCAETLERLRKRGLRLFMLSGDGPETTRRIGRQLGFAPEEIHAELGPEDKARLVERTPNAMMIGDGINDAPALMRARVGVAVSGGVDVALKSAKVYNGDPGLRGIAALFEVSERTLGAIRANLMLSLAYNVLGGLGALFGFVNPFAAALLMPLSSGFILALSWAREHR